VLIQLINSIQNRSRRGMVAARLTTEQAGIAAPVSKTFTLFGVNFMLSIQILFHF
jgi:hypothetical protein